jgi:outer membrane protein insertion porin family
LEKRANNSLCKPFAKIWFLGLFLLVGNLTLAQTSDFVKGKKYILDSISVRGIKTFNEQTVISYSGLRKGQEINIPGEEVSAVINKLWGLDLFSDINFYVTKVENNKVSVEIDIKELPTLTEVKINGLKKGSTETLIKDTENKKTFKKRIGIKTKNNTPK